MSREDGAGSRARRAIGLTPALGAVAAVLSLCAGCSRPPPRFPFPTAADAIGRMRATAACSRGLQGESKVDYFGEAGRIRATTLFVTSRPERLRFDVVSPFGVTLSTLTSDGRDFALLDVGTKQFFQGPASECNVARFLHVPVPPHALLSLLAGEAPVLVHEPSAARVSWDSGSYLVTVSSKHGAEEQIRLEPAASDWDLPWSTQRTRVTEVRVVQQGVELYRAEMEGFERAAMGKPREDPDGLDPPVPPSGPECHAELPTRIHVTSGASGDDVLLVHREIVHNPPLDPAVFRQGRPQGVKLRHAACL